MMINNVNADFIVGLIDNSDFNKTELYKILGHKDNFTGNMKRNGLSEKDLNKICAIFEIDTADPRLYVDEEENRTREWTELRKITSYLSNINGRLARIEKEFGIGKGDGK